MERSRIKLGDLENKHPFKVPEGYFEELPGIIQNRLPVRPERRASWSWNWQRVVTLAGTMAVVIALAWVTLPVRQGPLEPDALVAVSDEAILDYLRNQDIDFYDLAYQGVVQAAFSDESTLINYLEEVDDAAIRMQLLESMPFDENI